MSVYRPIGNDDPNVTVIIPTLPGNEMLVIESLQSQNTDDFEVIVIEDGSLNICEARNVGIDQSEADIIAQTDDDCMPPPDWIKSILKHFCSTPNLQLLEGPVDGHPFSNTERHYVGANLAYRREAALKINGFNSKFAGWRDDTEFGWRMEDAFGVENCRYDPSLVMTHDGPLRTSSDKKLDRKLMQKYPDRYFSILRDPHSKKGQILINITSRAYSVHPLLGKLLLEANPRS